MANLKYKLIRKGVVADKIIPLNIVMVDSADIKACGLQLRDACALLGKQFSGAVGINVFDMDAVTTTSDGIMVDTALIAMAASDGGKINPDFGYLEMAEMPYSEELIELEPHLKQWDISYKGRRLFRGPDPKTKVIPVHNVVMSGRAANNNSATEMMDVVTMEEILLPYLGQREIMTGGEVLLGYTGEVISVGIGMTVKELYGRVFPTRQFGAGDTAHGSGEYAKTLKRDIPCIVADKKVLAKYTVRALEAGMIPGKDIGCSPAVLSLAKAMGLEIAFDNITDKAKTELASIDITFESLKAPCERMTAQMAIDHADEIIPGVVDPTRLKASDISQDCVAQV
ncbi:MAG: hypothetical protein RR998_07390 [Oscillospiraceae bacterium]